MKKLKHACFSLLLLALLVGCKKEHVFTYDVDDVDVAQPGAVKPNVKSDLEVISIAYTDLFGSTIDAGQLEDLSLAYQSFGDKRLMIDMIILNFLNSSGVDIPSDADMRADIEQFVADTYRKFFVRQPTGFEQWYVSEQIRKDSDMSPELVYYAFMTSSEYRYY